MSRSDVIRAKLPLGEIIVGERDRQDVVDVEGLAASIAAIGLLHPIVVTNDKTLLAGARRLAAVHSLGWAEVPVTIVDLATAADHLAAELDENTCRVPLSPYEAARARERRARALAPKAAERKATRGSKLDPRQETKTRKLAALGTGYSGSTLDKVDLIRHAAEDGIVTLAGQAIPVPEAVRDVAASAVESVKRTGAAVDGEHKRVRQALDEFLAADPEQASAEIRKKARRLAGEVMRGLPASDPSEVALAADEALMGDFNNAERSLHEWLSAVRAARPRLHSIGAPR